MSVQFDRTRIAVRERSMIDILDLALRVTRANAGPLAVAFLVGVVPAMVFNHLLLASFLTPEVTDDLDIPFRYLLCMLPLAAWEAPLVTSGMTLYLGQSLFAQKTGAATLVHSLAGALPQLLGFQVVLRGLLLPAVAVPFFPLVLLYLVPASLVPYLRWPHLNEMILLERNPWRGPKGQITTARRIDTLHGGVRAELFTRWLVSLGMGTVLFLSLWGCITVGHFLLLADWEEASVAAYCVYFPLALWLVMGYFAVVRFLAYLDLRIRREGWEVELLMRAEQGRLARFASPIR